jgi:uncharacterized protein (TIGR03437 family)
MLPSPSRREFLSILAAGAASASTGLAQSTAAAFRSPYVQDLRRDRATISWLANTPGEGLVEVWDDSREVRQVAATMRQAGTRYRFRAVMNGLSPATSYGYRASMDGARIGLARFQTPGTPAFQFLAFGDSGTGSPVQRQLAQRMLQHTDAGFVLHTGDLVYPAGTYERYESLYFDYYEELMRNAPFFPCPGNHDYYEPSAIPYRALHAVPDATVPSQDQGRYYSFDWGNAHVISLDTNDSLFAAVAGTGDMLRWLDADLTASPKFWRIVVLHHSPYAEGAHSGEIEGKLIREHISPILEKHAVPLVLNGHEHSYQRSIPIRGTTYITTGGGGAPLHAVTPSPLVEKAVAEHHYVAVDVAGEKLRLRALRPDGSVLDTWDLAPVPTITSVVDAASFGPDLAAAGLASIFGHHLAAETAVVTCNGQAVPVLLASPGQINVLLPNITGEAKLVVRGPNGNVSRTLTLLPAAPAIFEGAVLHADGTPVTDASPAQPGESLSAYATGLGSGSEVSAEWNGTALAARSQSVTGLSGVHIVTFEVPPDPFAEARLHLLAHGKKSNPVRIAGAPNRPPA